MPIAVTCPGCQTKMKAPDAAAGKRVKCPKCQSVIAVPAPAFEVVETPAEDLPPEPPPRPASRPAPTSATRGRREDDDEDDDDREPPRRRRSTREDEEDQEETPKRSARKRPAEDEEEDEERPTTRKKRPARDEEDEDDDRPRAKRKKKGGLSPLVIGLIAVGALVFLGAGGYGAYALFIKSDKKPETAGGGGGGGGGLGIGKPKVPDGWKKVEAPTIGFTAYLPGETKELPTAGMPGPKLGKGKAKIKEPLAKAFAGETADEKLGGMAMGMKFDQDVPAAEREAAANVFLDLFAGGMAQGKDKPKTLESSEVPWLGGTAKQRVLEITDKGETGQLVVRVVIVGGNVYIGMIGAKGGRPSDERAFFENFELTK